MINVSIRATAGTGANTLIAGFVLSGNGPKPIVLRGIGPTLSSTFTEVSASNLPASSKDAAILLPLLPGAYSAAVSGINGAPGVALVEVYAVE